MYEFTPGNNKITPNWFTAGETAAADQAKHRQPDQQE